MAIYIEFEFETRTPVGWTYCTACEAISKDYRDVDTVANAVSLVKKFFSNKNYHNQCVTFFASTYYKGKHEVSRLWYNHKDGYDLAIFEGVGAYSNLTREKADAKLIREMYLNCADYTISVEKHDAEERAKAV